MKRDCQRGESVIIGGGLRDEGVLRGVVRLAYERGFRGCFRVWPCGRSSGPCRTAPPPSQLVLIRSLCAFGSLTHDVSVQLESDWQPAIVCSSLISGGDCLRRGSGQRAFTKMARYPMCARALHSCEHVVEIRAAEVVVAQRFQDAPALRDIAFGKARKVEEV